MEILKHSKVGNLLIQFHLGNMPDALTRKSMRLFATEVAAAASANCRTEFRPRAEMEDSVRAQREVRRDGRSTRATLAPEMGEVSVRTIDVRGRKVAVAEAGRATRPSSICTASPTCTAWRAISCRSISGWRSTPT